MAQLQVLAAHVTSQFKELEAKSQDVVDCSDLLCISMHDFFFYVIYLPLYQTIFVVAGIYSSHHVPVKFRPHLSNHENLRIGKSALWMRRERIWRNPGTLLHKATWNRYSVEDSCLCWTLKQVCMATWLLQTRSLLITISAQELSRLTAVVAQLNGDPRPRLGTSAFDVQELRRHMEAL